MTPSFDELLKTLKISSNNHDSIATQMRFVNVLVKEVKKITKVNREYHKELEALNNVSAHQTRNQLISSLKNEVKTIKDLETENQELESAINHHQHVLNVITAKYREQNSHLEKLNQMEKSYRIQNDLVDDRRKFFKQKIIELNPLLDSACVFDEAEISSQTKLIHNVKKDNFRIKKIFKSSINFDH